MRTIDADALLESAGLFEAKARARGCGKSILSLAKAWLFSEVEKAPTIDAIPVVRCKDCKHSYKGSPHGLMCECPVGGQNTSLLGGDDFCSCGERRNDDAD